MDSLTKGDDSDVEVLDNGLLRRKFFRQQLRLIAALSKCDSNIPRDWNNFKTFVERCAVGAVPNEQVIRSIWLKLCQVENTDHTRNVIEISDDEDGSSSLNRSYVVPKKKRKKRSIPATMMNEEEAEKLREQLLMDRLLELELPQVLRDVKIEKKSMNSRKRRSSVGIRRSAGNIINK